MTKNPAPRKQLSADALFRNIRESFRDIPDPRTGKPDISLPDARDEWIGHVRSQGAFSVGLRPAKTTGRTRNLRMFFHMEHVPCDTRLREVLDPVAPEQIRPAFRNAFT